MSRRVYNDEYAIAQCAEDVKELAKYSIRNAQTGDVDEKYFDMDAIKNAIMYAYNYVCRKANIAFEPIYYALNTLLTADEFSNYSIFYLDEIDSVGRIVYDNIEIQITTIDEMYDRYGKQWREVTGTPIYAVRDNKVIDTTSETLATVINTRKSRNYFRLVPSLESNTGGDAGEYEDNIIVYVQKGNKLLTTNDPS